MQTDLFQHTNPLPSVAITKVAKVLNPGEGLVRWANKVGLAGRTLEQARGGGKQTGTKVHSALKTLMDGHQPDLSDYPEAGRGYVRQLTDWWTHNDVQGLYLEEEVRSERHRFHGRLDLVRRCTTRFCHCYGEGARVADVKTGTNRAYAEHHLQLSAYKLGWPECGKAPLHICGAEVVCLPKDSSGAVVVESAMPPEAFLHALALWRFVDASNEGRAMDDSEAGLVREASLR